jgi:hypothetical protein
MTVADGVGPEQGADGADDQESGVRRCDMMGRGLGEDTVSGEVLEVISEPRLWASLPESAGVSQTDG